MAKNFRRGFKRTRFVAEPSWFCDGCQEEHPGLREQNEASNGKTYCHVAFNRWLQASGGLNFVRQAS